MADLRILIVDDEPLVRRGLRSLLDREPEVTVLGECRNGDEALEAILRLRPDVVFLDVQMPGRDGLEVAGALPPEGRPLIVFVTAFDRYAVRAFDIHAVDYLLKPFDDERFHTAMQRVRDRLRRRESGQLEDRLGALLEELRGRDDVLERFAIRTAGKVRFVPVAEVDWIEAADNYVRLHTPGGRHVLRETLKHLEERLDPGQFIRVHRSAMVNTARIREIEPLFNGEHTIVLTTGARVTLSRSYRDRFFGRMGSGR